MIPVWGKILNRISLSRLPRGAAHNQFQELIPEFANSNSLFRLSLQRRENGYHDFVIWILSSLFGVWILVFGACLVFRY
jgi:hypothetical protein